MFVFYPCAPWQNFSKQAYKQKTGEVKAAHLKRKIGVILIKKYWSDFISRLWLFKIVLLKALFMGVELRQTCPSADAPKPDFVYV